MLDIQIIKSAIKVFLHYPAHPWKAMAQNFSIIIIEKQRKFVFSPHNGRVDNVGPVGGSDDEDVLLAAHPVHLSEDLVDDSVRGSSSIPAGSSPGLGNTVQLIKEQDTGRS